MKPVLDGVFDSRNIRSWPLGRPRLMLDILPQLLDNFPIGRPVSPRTEIRRVVAELDRDGIAIMENVVPSALLQQASRDMDRFVARILELEGTVRTKPRSTGGTRDYPVHEYQRLLKVYRSHDPLIFSPAYAQFLLLPDLVEVAAGYLGKNWLYQAMIATRTEPVEPTRDGFAQWHHDARGRKLNVFLILTDVHEDGPATIVMKGSHRLLYARARREHNFFSDEEVAALQQRHGWSEAVCHAPAGSLVFFDSHTLHRGRRSPHLRDAFQVNCMTKRSHLWPQEIPADILSSLDEKGRRTLLQRADLKVI